MKTPCSTYCLISAREEEGEKKQTKKTEAETRVWMSGEDRRVMGRSGQGRELLGLFGSSSRYDNLKRRVMNMQPCWHRSRPPLRSPLIGGDFSTHSYVNAKWIINSYTWRWPRLSLSLLCSSHAVSISCNVMQHEAYITRAHTRSMETESFIWRSCKFYYFNASFYSFLIVNESHSPTGSRPDVRWRGERGRRV